MSTVVGVGSIRTRRYVPEKPEFIQGLRQGLPKEMAFVLTLKEK